MCLFSIYFHPVKIYDKISKTSNEKMLYVTEQPLWKICFESFSGGSSTKGREGVPSLFKITPSLYK